MRLHRDRLSNTQLPQRTAHNFPMRSLLNLILSLSKNEVGTRNCLGHDLVLRQAQDEVYWGIEGAVVSH